MRDDPRAWKRDLRGALAGATAAVICLAPIWFANFPRLYLFLLVTVLTVLGCAAGGVGSNATKSREAVLAGALMFMIVPLFLLPFLIFGFSREEWNRHLGTGRVVLDVAALLASAGSLGGLCGLVGNIAGRAVPTSNGQRQRLQFTIQEMAWLFPLLALYLGLFLYCMHR